MKTRKSYFSKALVLLMAVMMVFTMMPSGMWGGAETAWAAEEDASLETINVTMTVSNKGTIAIENGTMLANVSLKVADADKDGKITFHDALTSLHKKFNKEDGYVCSETGWVTEFWNDTSGNYLFIKNDAAFTTTVKETQVAEGDRLVASVNSDGKYYADWYTYFDETEKVATVNESITLELKGFQGMSGEAATAVSGMQIGMISNDGSFTQLGETLTGEDGKATVSFDEEGIYYITAKGTVSDKVITDWTSMSTATVDCPIIAPICKVTVTQMAGTGTQSDPIQIKTASDLQYISEKASNNTFENTYFKFANDITLATNWMPIGTEKSRFAGNIDGDGHLLTIPKGEKALLGYTAGASLKNLNIFGEQIDSNGVVTSYATGKNNMTCITIDNVTLKKGTKTLESGFIGGYASGTFTIVLQNCTVEEGVVIGYDGTKSNIGSFGGDFNGTITNCTSAATVRGTNFVGGIVGSKGQSMGKFVVENCKFTGDVNGTGNYVGGISGAGYGGTQFGMGSAPNAVCPTIKGCKVNASISGANYVGGILGGEGATYQCWENGAGEISNNTFKGELAATSDNACVGGIIGFIAGLDRYNTISENSFSTEADVERGIGFVQYVDTSCETHETASGATYINTGDGTPLPDFKPGTSKWDSKAFTKKNHNRADDPLGKDADTLAKKVQFVSDEASVAEAKAKIERIEFGVNQSSANTETALKKAIEDRIATLNLGDVIATVKITSFTAAVAGASTNTGGKAGSYTAEIELSQGKAKDTVNVSERIAATVYTNPQEPNQISVYFTLLGDEQHDSENDKKVHALSKGNLKTWIERKFYKVAKGSTVWDLIIKVQQDVSDLSFSNPSGNYVTSVTYKGVTVGEFTNGKNDGWMFTYNGKHGLLGVAEQQLKDGDEIVFHYTDDYTVEQGSEQWNGGGAAEEVKDVTSDTKTGTTTAPTEVKVTEKVNADGTKSKVAEVKVSADNQKEILKQAKANKSKEIILSVATKAVGEATKADVTLDKSFIDSIVKDTDAKLTVKTPFGDKTYTQDELKALSAAATGTTVTIAVEKAAEEPAINAKELAAKLTPVARSAKTAKKNVKVTVSLDKQDKEILSQLTEAGYTVKYRFYRSTKKSAGFKSTVTKKTATYTNTSGKKGTKYFYKVQVRVYDENGKLVAKTALKQCKYASRTWSR